MPEPDYVRRVEVDALIAQRRTETQTALDVARREMDSLRDRIKRLESLVWKVITGALTGAGGISFAVSKFVG